MVLTALGAVQQVPTEGCGPTYGGGHTEEIRSATPAHTMDTEVTDSRGLVCVSCAASQLTLLQRRLLEKYCPLAPQDSNLTCILILSKHDVVIKAQGKWEINGLGLRDLASAMNCSEHITWAISLNRHHSLLIRLIGKLRHCTFRSLVWLVIGTDRVEIPSLIVECCLLFPQLSWSLL